MVKHVNIRAGQTMVQYVQVMAPAKPTDVNAMPSFKVKPVTPASINTTTIPIVPLAIKGIPYCTNAPHARLVETLRRHVKTALTATLRIATIIVPSLDAPSVKKIISGHLLTH